MNTGLGALMLSVLLQTAVKGLVLLLLACLAVLLLRRASASARHWVWMLTLVSLIALPLLALILPAWNLPILPGNENVAAAPVPVGNRGGADSPHEGGLPARPKEDAKDTFLSDMENGETASLDRLHQETNEWDGVLPSPAATAEATIRSLQVDAEDSDFNSIVWILLAWFGGFLFALSPMFVGTWAVAKLIRRSDRSEDRKLRQMTEDLCHKLDIKRLAPIFTTQTATMPMVWGVWNPILIFPSSFLTWPGTRQRFVLLHELAHIKRRDCFWQVLGRLGASLHWFNPLCWLALHRLRIERERACDDFVVKAGMPPHGYADFLLDSIRSLQAPAPVSAAAVTMAKRSQFEGRLIAILDDDMVREPVSAKMRNMSFFLIAVILLPVAMVQCTSRKSAEEHHTGIVKEGTLQFPLSDSEAARVDEDTQARMFRVDWPQYRGTPDHNNYRNVNDEIICPKILWRAESARCPAVVDDDVYAGGESLRLIDLCTGAIKATWKAQDMEGEFNIYGTPVVLSDRVITHGNTEKVYALSLDLKKILWEREAKGIRFFSGVCEGDLFIISAGTRILALNIEDGEIRWSKRFSRVFKVEMTPAIVDGKIFFGAASGNFHAYDLEGNELWTYEGEHAFAWTDPVVAFGKVFVGDRSGSINAFDVETGAAVWRRSSGWTGLSVPGIMPGSLFVGFGREVKFYNEKTGEDMPGKGSFPTGINPFGSPTLIGGTLYFGNLDGHLYAFDYETEKLKWAFEVGEGKQVTDFIYTKGILLVNSSEGLYALGNDQEQKELPKNFVLVSDRFTPRISK
ncbi:MAG: M56 family metallopeptidase [Planctomycetota bacterium]